MSTVDWIRKTIGKKLWLVGGLGLAQSLQALCGILFALVMRRAVDSAVAGDGAAFWNASVCMGAVALFQIFLRTANRYLDERARASIDNCLRKRAFHSILNQEYREIDGIHSGELMNRITSDTAVVTDGVVSMLPGMTAMTLRIVMGMFVLYTISPVFVLVLFTGGILMAILSMLPRKWLKRMHKRVQEADGIVRSFLQECLESLLIIRTFGCEDKMEQRAAGAMEAHFGKRMEKSHVANFFSTGLGIAMQCGYLFGFVWGGFGILQGNITYGTLMAVIQLMGQIQTPFVNIGGILPKYSALLASGERLMELEDKAAESQRRKSSPGREELYERMSSICFRHLDFSYDDDKKVLEDENFSVSKGEFVAFAGVSGIGKSTIMKLILSVYRPLNGDVLFCTEDEEMPVSCLPADMFAYVPQGNHLMSGSIYEVVGFAERSGVIDREKVEKACRDACADGFIRELPGQYETVLGEKGSGLSEGQMQRLAVARALYSESPVLLLDEATSALDAGTERELILSLRRLENRTVLMVTHRQEVLKLCDRVLERV